MIRRALRAEPFATPVLAVPDEPAVAAEPIPGLAEARLAVAKAQELEADLALDVQRAAQAARESEARRSKLLAAIARGGDVSPSAIEAEDEAIRDAVGRIALRQEALPIAEAATKAAERHVTEVLRAELRRRAPLVKRAAEEALAVYQAAQARFSDLDVLQSEAARTAANSATPAAALQALLDRTAEFAPSMRGDVG
jgi:hypothetical protein